MATDDPQLPSQESPAPSLPYPGVGQTWQLLLAYIGGGFLVGGVFFAVIFFVVKSRGGPFEERTANALMAWTVGFLQIVIVGMLLLGGRKKAGRSWSEVVPLSAFDLRLLAVLPVVAVGLQVILAEVINVALMVMPDLERWGELLDRLTGAGWGSLFSMAIVAPLAEEALFRGLVWQGYVRRYGPRNAVLYSALMFAVWHLNPLQMPGAFVAGLVLGWLRHRTGSIWPCVWLHALFNGVVVAEANLLSDVPATTAAVERSFLPWWLDLSGVALTALGLFLLWRLLEKKNPAPSAG
ncbi:MAG TPA: type II CAAX endopeptidase family protein [Polyangia bacterium]|nr:type II CAAX endopeptidase family protein [Polyangia bacterium]